MLSAIKRFLNRNILSCRNGSQKSFYFISFGEISQKFKTALFETRHRHISTQKIASVPQKKSFSTINQSIF